MKYINLKIIILSILFIPLLTSAQTRFAGVRELITAFSGIVSLLIIVVAGLALLAFFWGLFKFISKAGDSKTHAEGRQFMLWGVIALFVMVSVWGLVRFIQQNLGIQGGGIFRIEDLNSRTGSSGGSGTGGTSGGGTGGSGSGGTGFEPGPCYPTDFGPPSIDC